MLEDAIVPDDGAAPNPRRHEHRGHAHAQPIEQKRFARVRGVRLRHEPVGRHAVRRRHVIEDAAVLVVRDQERRRLP